MNYTGIEKIIKLSNKSSCSSSNYKMIVYITSQFTYFNHPEVWLGRKPIATLRLVADPSLVPLTLSNSIFCGRNPQEINLKLEETCYWAVVLFYFKTTAFYPLIKRYAALNIPFICQLFSLLISYNSDLKL